jgi:hypothetical protein
MFRGRSGVAACWKGSYSMKIGFGTRAVSKAAGSDLPRGVYAYRLTFKVFEGIFIHLPSMLRLKVVGRMSEEWRYSFTCLDLGIKCRRVVSFTSLPLFHRGKSPQYALDRRQVMPQRRSGRCRSD